MDRAEQAAYAEVMARSAQLGPCRDSRGFAWVVDPMRALLAGQREYAWLAALDSRFQLVELQELERGERSSVAVCYSQSCADVAARAQARQPWAIFAHNHPRGDPTPSRADAELTQVLASALWRRKRVYLLDSIVLGQGEHFSFYEGLRCKTPNP